MSLRLPKQDRSRRTLDRLTEAAMELMSRRGVEHTSVSAIVREARSSVGSFYARFDGKDDFVRYLEGRVWEDARERWDRAMQALDVRSLTTPQLVGGVVRLLVETGEADRGRRRVLGTASGSNAKASAFHRHVLDSVADVLLERRGEFAHPDPERAVSLGYRVIAGALPELSTQTEAPYGSGPEALVAELTRLYLAYLGSDAAPPTPRVAPAGVQSVALAGAVSSAPTGAAKGAAKGAATEVTPAPLPDEGPGGAVEPAEKAAVAAAAADTEQKPTSAPAQPAEAPASPSDPSDENEPERVDFFDVWG